MSTHVSTETMVSDNDHNDDDGARYVIVGHGRLALSVARKLTARAAEVVIVTRDAKAKTQFESKLVDLTNGHGKHGRVPQLQVVTGDGDWNVLADPELDLSGSKRLLALADQREDNLRAARWRARPPTARRCSGRSIRASRTGSRRSSMGRRGSTVSRVRIRDAWVEASTLATRVLIGLIAVVTIVVIMFFPLHGVADGVYLWVITALGNPYQGAASSPHHAMVSALGLLSGGVALGLWVSLMSAYFIERRMIETTQRRARRLRHHVVVVGLSDVGLRVAELLGKLGIRYAIVDTGDRDAARRSLELARDRPPILGGELENAMEQAGVDRAAAVIACSNDNLVNVEACLRAKRRPCAVPVRTVARIFDDVVAERAARMFGVDRQIAAVDVAAPAFVDAAVHGDGVREIGELDGLSLKALCRRVEDIAEYGQPADWDRRGVRLLAVWDGKEIKPPPGNVVPTQTKSVILAGPAQNIDRLAGSSPR